MNIELVAAADRFIVHLKSFVRRYVQYYACKAQKITVIYFSESAPRKLLKLLFQTKMHKSLGCHSLTTHPPLRDHFSLKSDVRDQTICKYGQE